VIHTQRLTKTYPDGTVALDGVDLDVPRGEAVVLLGSNGSGKSTLLRCLTRLLEPTSGEIQIGGVDVASASSRELRAVRRRVGFVFQHINLVEHVSVLSNVLHGQLGRQASPRQWFGIAATRESRVRAMDCLARVRMADFAGKRADQLSGGQRQRIALARMLMQQPEVVLADEPVAALDPRAGREVMDLLWGIVDEEGMTLLCTLHQLELARTYGRRIIGLRDGRSVVDRSLHEFGDDDIALLYDQTQHTAAQARVEARNG
jgi:phosphonate transport system ATP-binding protein